MKAETGEDVGSFSEALQNDCAVRDGRKSIVKNVCCFSEKKTVGFVQSQETVDISSSSALWLSDCRR